jgi:murein L,D-transpeptidase YcbB/YkuD
VRRDEAFYAARNYAPLWIADGQLDARAKSVIAQLANAAVDGLDPANYQIPAFGAATGAEALPTPTSRSAIRRSPMPAT